MAQNTNLNVSPYFDDFDPSKNYHRVLFKPGYPIQARELNTLQSDLQNQIEKFGNHFFKEGQKVVPGNTNYFKNFDCVQINNSFIGVSIGEYFDKLEGLIIVGENSGVSAKVIKVITDVESDRNTYTLYVSYINSSIANNSSKTFIDDENLLTTSPFTYRNITIGENDPFARTISTGSISTGSAFGVNNGIYFIRGNFVEVGDQLIILDQYSNSPNYRIGFYVNEELITSNDDFSLNDNARGFTNYAAAGADRLKITVELNKKDLSDYDDDNFIELVSVKDGVLSSTKNNTSSIVNEEDSSLNQFKISVHESLDDEISNNGLFKSNRLTYNGNVPSEDLITYKVSPGKVVINNEIVETLDTVFLDAPKPRKVKKLNNQSINYFTGPTLSVNRFSGSPIVGGLNDYVLSLRSQRVGFTTFLRSGDEIGIARVHDYKLKDVGYSTISSEKNTFDLSLYDIQLYTDLTLDVNVTLTIPTYVRGVNSGSVGYLKSDVTGSNVIRLYQTNGDFKIGEELIFNEIDSITATKITSIKKYEIDSVKSVFGDAGGGNIFVADLIQYPKLSAGTIGLSTESPLTVLPSTSTSISTVTSSTIGIASTAPLSMVGVVTALDHDPLTVVSISTSVFDVVSPTIGIATIAPISMVGIVTGPIIAGFVTYAAASNQTPEITWTSPTLPAGVSTGTYTLMIEDLSSGDVHWHVTGIAQSVTAIGAGATEIQFPTPTTQILQNYIMNADGPVGVGTIDPSVLAISAEYISGLTSTGYAGPQPPLGEFHTYRISLTADLIGSTTSSITTSITVGFGSTGSTPIPASFAPTYPDGFDVGIVSYFPLYVGAGNSNPELSWSFGALPVGVALSSYEIHFQDLSNGRVQWHVSDIPTGITSVGFGTTGIPGATIQKNYLMSTAGAIGVGTVDPSIVAIGASYISGITTVGYSGPQPPAGEEHIYRLSVSGILSGSPSTLTTSITVGFGSTGSTLIPASYPALYPDSTTVVVPAIRGISTATSASVDFILSLKIDDLITFTKPGEILPTFGRVIGIGSTTFAMEATPAVPGVCEIGVTTTSITVSDATLVSSNYSSSSDNTFYTPLPKRNVENIDLSLTNTIFRRQYDIVSVGGTTNTLTCSSSEEFIEFTKDRYTASVNGSIQRLTSSNISISPSKKALTLVGLSTDGAGKVTVSVKNLNATFKTKQKNRVKTLVIDKTKNAGSGSGLVFGNYPYGTRIEDREISLNVPDVIKVYGIFESNTSSDPSAPRIIFNTINSPSNSTSDLVIGEIMTGSISRSKAIVAEIINSTQISFIYINSNRFDLTENIVFEESGVTATVDSISNGSKNITSQYRFKDGQNQNYYDYSSIIRTSLYGEPKGKLKVYFLSASYSSSDNGDLTVANSYSNFDYVDEIRSVNGIRNTDLIDIRPRVSEYIVLPNQRSPFEFDARRFQKVNSSAYNILAIDESINVSYSYYIPRIDKLFLSKNGLIEVKYGNDSESLENPEISANSIEIGSITLPPYLYNPKQSLINNSKNKKYTINDLKSLDDRVKDLEKSTSLSLLEVETNSLFIRDSHGLNRFKSGFYVDDFTSLFNQELSLGIKNSIDIENKTLRPAHTTTEVDLILGSELISGITSITNLNADSRYLTSIQGNSIKKTGDLITLDYTEKEWLKNPFATRDEKLNPFGGKFWQGSIHLNPSSDVWLDNTKVSSTSIEVNASYLGLSEWLVSSEDIDFNSGFIPVQWNSWSITWTGKLDSGNELQNSTNYDSYNKLNSLFGNGSVGNKLSELNSVQDQFLNGTTPNYIKYEKGFGITVFNDEKNLSTLSPLSKRSGGRGSLRSRLNTHSVNGKLLTDDVVTYLRSRNIEFIADRLKPFTQLYSYFDGIDLTQYTTPKLIPIQMDSGTFLVGETVIGYSKTTNKPTFKFRISQSNHKNGPYNAPTAIYEENPYNRLELVNSTYSPTSEYLNVDTYSLSEKNNFDFYGYVESEMVLYGQTSLAKATVGNVQLLTDKNGHICGSIFIPNPNDNTRPSFETGTKTITLTSNPTNSKGLSAVTTIAEEVFVSQGVISSSKDSIFSTRVVKIERESMRDNESNNSLSVSSGSSRSTRINSSVSNYQENNGIYSDPLAQTFFVDDITGIFLTKLEVYFSQKDVTIPVTCQIRTIENGIPTNKIIPFSEVTLNPNQVSVSSDASLGTTFEFESPVYLNGKTEYAIVLLSNSPDYKVWISRNGEVDISNSLSLSSTKILVSNVSLVNSLFKPQNTSEWDSSEYESLKFTLSNSVFSSEGDVNFYNPNLTISNDQITNLSDNPLVLNSRKLLIGIGTTVNDSGLQLGNTITQVGSNASGTLVGFGTTTPIIIGVATANITSTTVGFGTTAPFSMVGIATTSVTPAIGIYGVGIGSTLTGLLGTAYAPASPSATTIDGISPADIASILALPSSGVGAAISNFVGGGGGLTLPPGGITVVSVGATSISLSTSFVGTGPFAPPATISAASSFDLVSTGGIGALNTSPQLSWNFGSLPVGVAITSYNLLLEDLSASNAIHWSVVGIATSITSIPENVGSTGFGTGSTINPTFIGNFPTIGVSSGGYSGPQPPFGENHTYKLSISALLGGASSSTLTTSLTFNFDPSGAIIPTTSTISPDNLNVLSSTAIPSSLIVDNVQGQFLFGSTNFIQYTNSLGVTTTLNSSAGNATPLPPIIVLNDGLHIRVNQKNHGMHSKNNFVRLSNIKSDVEPTILSSDLSLSDTTIFVDSSTNFSTFENIGVSTIYNGYLLINDEIISYESVPSSTSIGISSRSVDGTKSYDYPAGTLVYKYEIGGVSLRRLNKLHDLNDVTISNSVDFDYYHIKVGMSSEGVLRSSNPSYPDLYFNKSKVSGGKEIYSTKNIQFESLTPIVQKVIPSGTNIITSVKTVTGTSVGSTESSYVDTGYQNISLEETTYFDSPRLIASNVNESSKLSTLPGNKSLNMRMNLSTTDDRISPVIDLDRVAVLLTENRINNPISDYVNDSRANTLYDDPNAFQYVSKQINLATPATGIKLILSANINPFSDIRAFYSINNRDGEKPLFTPFPGFSNFDEKGNIINVNNNDGSSDNKVQVSSNLSYTSESSLFNQYEFTMNDLQPFRDFRIKLVLTSTNQAFVPTVKELKAIALA